MPEKKPLPTHLEFSQELKKAIYSFNIGPGTKVLQVGACCGVGGDPLYPLIGPHKRWVFWRVEPRIDMFDKLARLHNNDDHVLVHQAAVIPDDQEEGVITMWEYQQVDGLPPWTEGVASLTEEVPRRNNRWREQSKPDQVKTEIVPVEVLGQHFDSMCKEIRCFEPDVVITDMEAHDRLVILPSIKLAHKPKVVAYEHKVHGDEINRELETALSQAGYELHFRGPEDVCWKLKG